MPLVPALEAILFGRFMKMTGVQTVTIAIVPVIDHDQIAWQRLRSLISFVARFMKNPVQLENVHARFIVFAETGKPDSIQGTVLGKAEEGWWQRNL